MKRNILLVLVLVGVVAFASGCVPIMNAAPSMDSVGEMAMEFSPISVGKDHIMISYSGSL